jgi:type II secretion system protein N
VELLYIDTLTVGFAPMGLLTGGLMARIDAAVGGGRITGTVLVKTGRTEMDLKIDGVGLNSIPAIAGTGFKISGSLGGKARVTLKPDGCPEAVINLKGTGLDVYDLKIKGFSLPFGKIKDAGLKARVLDCRARIEALWIDGNSMSARIGGLISLTEPLRRSPLDLDVDIVARGQAAGDAGLPLLLNNYRRSANHYSIKIGGTLAEPSVRPQ